MNYKLDVPTTNIPKNIKKNYNVLFSDYISPNLLLSGGNLLYREIIINIYNNKDKINIKHKQLTTQIYDFVSKLYTKLSNKKKLPEVTDLFLDWIEILLLHNNRPIENDILVLFDNNDINSALYLVANYSKVKPTIKINDFNNNFNNYCNKIITTIKKQKLIIGTSGIELDERMQLKYIISQFYIMLNCLDNNGTFIFRVGSIYTKIILKIINICNNIFKDVFIVKPTINDILNLQVYIICKKFDKNKGYELLHIFKEIIELIDTKQHIIDILDNYNISQEYTKIILNINSKIQITQNNKLEKLNNDNKTNINITEENKKFKDKFIKNINL